MEKENGRVGPGPKSTTSAQSLSVIRIGCLVEICCLLILRRFPAILQNSVQVTLYFLSLSGIISQNVLSEGNMANNKTNHQSKKQVHVQ